MPPENPTQEEVDRRLAGTKPIVHFHPEPACTGSTHDRSCEGKGQHVGCCRVSYQGFTMCACVHIG